MERLGVQTYRFSVSWPRVVPGGKAGSAISQKGLGFYANLVSELRSASIRPVVTLYHWDLPQSLQVRGAGAAPSWGQGQGGPRGSSGVERARLPDTDALAPEAVHAQCPQERDPGSHISPAALPLLLLLLLLLLMMMMMMMMTMKCFA
jgi:hypothetical protein